MTHLTSVCQFTPDIRFVRGLDEPAADALSSVAAANSCLTLLSLEDLAATQCEDSELQLLQASFKYLVLQTVYDPLLASPLIYDTATDSPRPFVLASFQRAVFRFLLTPAIHPRIKVTWTNHSKISLAPHVH